MSGSMDELAAVAKILQECQEVLLATHQVADGDCLGSMLALYLALNGEHRRVWPVHPEPVPETYRFLIGWPAIALPQNLDRLPSVAVVLDCTDLARVGSELEPLLARVPTLINLDHHAGNRYFGHLNYVRPEAAATAELVYDLLELMGIALSPEVALSLYTGLVTDTGCFQYENTSPRSHLIAARLLQAGVSPPEVHRKLWEEKPLPALRLLAKALPTLAFAADGRIAWVTVTREMMEEVQAGPEHCEGLIEYPRSLAGVEVAILFRETGPGEVKVGFRSKQVVDVNRLAARFGGGGHRRAAGCRLHLPLEQAVPLVVNAAAEAVTGRG
ncbi:MAG: DHH family phosphoesterase [Moorellales bacterium]